MKENSLHTLVIILAVAISFLTALFTTISLLKQELEPYQNLKQELDFVKDSIQIQHNTYQFVIPKDTIINQTIKIHCIK